MGIVFLVFAFLTAVIPGSEGYLAGHKAEKEGRYADAGAAYAKCAAKEGPLQPYARAREAACRAASGDREGAVAAYEQVLRDSPDGPWVEMVQTELAVLYTHAGDGAKAQDCFERILTPQLTPWWYERYQWAAAESLAKDAVTAPKAFAFYRRLLEEPGYRGNRYKAAECLAKSPEPADQWAAAEAMVRFGSVKSAQPLVAALSLVASGENLPRWQYLEGRVFIGTGKMGDGRALLRRVADEHRDTPWARMALAWLVRSYPAGKEDSEQQVYLNRLMADYPDSAEAGDALWWLGGQYLDKGKFDLALADYERLATAAPNHDKAADAVMAIGRTYQAMNNVKQALFAFDSLVKRFPASPLRPQAAYWAGRLHEASLDKKGAIECYRSAAEGAFGDYYGSRALARLHDLDAKDPAARGVVALPGAGLKVGLFQAPPVESIRNSEKACNLDQLARLQFFGNQGLSEGEWEALYLAGKREAGPGAPALYATMADAGLGHTALQIIDMLRWGFDGGAPTSTRLRVTYPRAYWNEVERVARETGVDPYLILSVARQESTFRASIASVAGAEGVMQLMPATAKWLAGRDPGVPAECAANLDEPASSLRMGAYYLAQVLRENDGNIVYALAAYNAGPGNVRKWRRSQKTDDMESFIETIPLSETRDYVKRVLGNYAAYRSLYRSKGQDKG